MINYKNHAKGSTLLSRRRCRVLKKNKAKIKEFKEKGKTIIFVSHDPTSIMEMCDEALYLDNGKIQIIGEPAMVASAYQHIADN